MMKRTLALILGLVIALSVFTACAAPAAERAAEAVEPAAEPAATAEPDGRILLRNGLVVDGSGEAPYVGSVLLNGDKIESVTAGDVTDFGGTIYDCTDKVIMPGIIDAHSHQDRYVDFKDPIPFYEPFLRQGVTSTITGNCGSSATGYLGNSEFKSPRDPYGPSYYGTSYPTLDEWFAWLEGKTPFNVATLVGHGTARGSISGYSNQEALTPEQLEQMKAILQEGLEEGACGISLGLMYEPSRYGTPEELTACAELCAAYNKPLSIHPRAESRISGVYNTYDESHLLIAFDEIYDICKATGAKYQYSHAIFVGETTFGDVDAFIERLEKAHSEGVDVMFDIYSPTYGASTITVIAPAWLLALPYDQMLTEENIARATAEFDAICPLIGFGLPEVRISKANCEGLKKYEGKFIPEIAADLGVSNVEAYIWCIVQSEAKAGVLQYKYTTEEIVQRLSKRDDMFFMSDAWLLKDTEIQNPALYGNFTRFLVWTREGLLNSLEDSVRKMSGAVADRYDLENVGYLREGYNADVTVLDYENLAEDMDNFECSTGTTLVFVNGVKVLENDTPDYDALAAMPGKAWRAKVIKN